MPGVVQESPELYGAVVGFINAVGLLLVAFNVVFTQTQLVAAGAVANTGLVLALVIRAQWKLGKAAKP